MEFLKLAALAVTISGVVGTLLGYLVKLIVERGDTVEDAIKRALDDIRRGRVVTLDDFDRDAPTQKKEQLV